MINRHPFEIVQAHDFTTSNGSLWTWAIIRKNGIVGTALVCVMNKPNELEK